jgi:hypothetical protein
MLSKSNLSCPRQFQVPTNWLVGMTDANIDLTHKLINVFFSFFEQRELIHFKAGARSGWRRPARSPASACHRTLVLRENAKLKIA